MDEFAFSQGSYSSAQSQPRSLRRTSLISQTSAQTVPTTWPHRSATPVLRQQWSTNSIRSDASETDRSEIIAPVPNRHHILQTESQHWLGTPPLSPYTPPISPLSATATSSLRSRKRLSQTLSVNALAGFDSRRVISHAQTTFHPYKERRPEDDGNMAKRWLRWMHHGNMKAWIVPSLVLMSVWVKWAVGLGSYSGLGSPPMYGDYEAQRHWMELTIHLPTRQWYIYDLQYWGLDYPPLTAYVSWICGIIGSWVDPTWVALDKSRGIETPGSKVFMRSTVLALDTLIYVPALVMFTRVWQGTRSSRTQNLALLMLLLQPALIIIDFGHFQYNSVMLGFTLLAMNFFAAEKDLLGAICFVLGLGFKQMALYYAPAIGSYLLAKCLYLGPSAGSKLFIRLGVVTIASFVLLFLPFLPPIASLSTIRHPITRIFPFQRGLFEDKVANFWCATNVVLKWRSWATQGALLKLSTALTALGFLPAVVTLLLSGYKLRFTAVSPGYKTSTAPTPILPLLPYALLTSSLAFFLFSFQVHEKTILVPLLPMTLLLSGSSPDEQTFELGMLMNNIAMFSMWPLLKRDGQGIQYIALLILWNKTLGYNPFQAPRRSFIRIISVAIYTAAFTLHLAELCITPPTRLPDIFPVLNVLISMPVFALVWVWSIKRSIEVSWALGGLRSRPNVPAAVQKRPRPSTLQQFPSDGQLAQSIDGEASQVKDEVTVRTSGLRTMSLGFVQGKRRKASGRSGSMDLR